MVIALDIDDTITRHPPFFSVLSQALVAAGHTVVIITYRQDREEAAGALEGWGIAYDTLVTHSLEIELAEGYDPEQWKARVCREHGVEVFFEDSARVLKHVDPGTLCLLAVDPDRHDLDRLGEDA